jgi:hypothetical protein
MRTLAYTSGGSMTREPSASLSSGSRAPWYLAARLWSVRYRLACDARRASGEIIPIID